MKNKHCGFDCKLLFKESLNRETNRKPGLVPDANILEDAYDRLIFDLAGGDDNDRFSD